jgi:hypothetical protein
VSLFRLLARALTHAGTAITEGEARYWGVAADAPEARAR